MCIRDSGTIEHLRDMDTLMDDTLQQVDARRASGSNGVTAVSYTHLSRPLSMSTLPIRSRVASRNIMSLCFTSAAMESQSSEIQVTSSGVDVYKRQGWKSARNNLEETFDVLEHIYNISDMENGIINEVMK